MLGSNAAPRRPSAPSLGSARLALLMAGTLGLGLALGILDDLVGPVVLASGLAGLVAVAAAGVVAQRLPPPVRRGGAALALAAGSALVGVGLAAVGGLAGPVVMVLLPLVLLAGSVMVLRPVTALVLVILLLPFGLLELPGNPLGLQVMQLVGLGAVGTVVVSQLVQGHAPLRMPGELVWAAIFVAWGLLATLSAVDLEIAIRQLLQLVVAVCLALVVTTLVRDLGLVRQLLWLLVGVAAASTLPALLGGQGFRAAYGGAVVSGRLEGTFTQPNQFGSFTMVTLLLGIALALGARSARERLLALVATAPLVLGLLLSLSRSSWIGVIFGIAVLVVLLPAARRTLVLAAVPLAAVAVAIGAFAPDEPQVSVVGARLSTLAETGGGNPYDSRPRIWAEGVREVKLDPLTGHGPGGFVVMSVRSASGAQTIQAEHAHNVLLTAAAEYGLPGALLLVGLTASCGALVRRGVRRAAERDAPLVAGLGAAAVAIAAQGLVDYTMRNTVLFTLFWLLAGLLVAAGRAAVDSHDAQRDGDATAPSRDAHAALRGDAPGLVPGLRAPQAV